MALDRNWLAGVDWALRSREFGSLFEHTVPGGNFIAARFGEPADADVTDRLWRRWIELPEHPQIFEAVGVNWIRYAAIDFGQRALRVDGHPRAARRLARWGLAIARALDFVATCIPAGELGWFACPIVKIDVAGEPRIGFLAPAESASTANRVPPEVLAQWPHCDERALVFVTGQLLLSLVETEPGTARTPIGQVLTRALARDPAQRFASLGELGEALIAAGAKRNRRPVVDPAMWWRLETGLAYLVYDRPSEALRWFETALELDRKSVHARAACREALRRGAERPRSRSTTDRLNPLLPRPPARVLAWADAEPKARRFERDRCFLEALRIYQIIQYDDANRAALDIAHARCHLELGELGHAIDHAQRALAVDPAHLEAIAIRAEALLRKRQYVDALAGADVWLAIAPTDGRAHYARGKALFALGRLADARAAFDRACELEPKLVAAMLLRREADRAMKHVRDAVGVDDPLAVDPARITALREVLESVEQLARDEELSRPPPG